MSSAREAMAGSCLVADLSFLPWYRDQLSTGKELPVAWNWMNSMMKRSGVKAAYEGAVCPAGGEVDTREIEGQ